MRNGNFIHIAAMRWQMIIDRTYIDTFTLKEYKKLHKAVEDSQDFEAGEDIYDELLAALKFQMTRDTDGWTNAAIIARKRKIDKLNKAIKLFEEYTI